MYTYISTYISIYVWYPVSISVIWNVNSYAIILQTYVSTQLAKIVMLKSTEFDVCRMFFYRKTRTERHTLYTISIPIIVVMRKSRRTKTIIFIEQNHLRPYFYTRLVLTNKSSIFLELKPKFGPKIFFLIFLNFMSVYRQERTFRVRYIVVL